MNFPLRRPVSGRVMWLLFSFFFPPKVNDTVQLSKPEIWRSLWIFSFPLPPLPSLAMHLGIHLFQTHLVLSLYILTVILSLGHGLSFCSQSKDFPMTPILLKWCCSSDIVLVWKAHFPTRVLVNFSVTEYGEQTKSDLLRLVYREELEPRWDDLDQRPSSQEAILHVSPHDPTFPRVQLSSSAPYWGNILRTVDSFQHNSLLCGAWRKRDGELPTWTRWVFTSVSSVLHPPLLPIFYRWPQPYSLSLSLTAWTTMVWTPVHHATLLFKSNILLAPLPWSPWQPHWLPLNLGFRMHILENSKPIDPQWIFRRLSPSVFPVLMLFLHSSSQLILGRVQGTQHLGRNIFYLDSPQPLTCSYWTNKKSKHNHPSQRAQESLQTLNYH